MSATLYLLLSSLLHATWNSLLKRETQKNTTLFYAVIWATLLAWVCVFVFHQNDYGNAFALSLCSGIIEGLYFVTLAHALNDAPLAIAYSVMRSLSMLLSWIFSFWLVHETLSTWSAIGVGAILVGLSIPLFSDSSSKGHRLFWSYLCALTITGYNFTYNRALHLGAKPLILFATSLAITLPFLYYSLDATAKKNFYRLQILKNIPLKSSLILGTIILASFSSFLYGLKDTLPAAAITIRNASIAFALIFSLILGEKLKAKEILVLIFILFGVFMVSLATIMHY